MTIGTLQMFNRFYRYQRAAFDEAQLSKRFGLWCTQLQRKFSMQLVLPVLLTKTCPWRTGQRQVAPNTEPKEKEAEPTSGRSVRSR